MITISLESADELLNLLYRLGGIPKLSTGDYVIFFDEGGWSPCTPEDAAESFGATYEGVQTGSFGDYSVISFNGNKIITGSSGGMLLCDDEEDANKIRKWSTQSREDAPWYQHEELGYNYRMSNIIAGIVRGQLPYLNEHIAQKKAIYERYKEGL